MAFQLVQTDTMHDRIVEPALTLARAFPKAIDLLYTSRLDELECLAVVGADLINAMAVIR